MSRVQFSPQNSGKCMNLKTISMSNSTASELVKLADNLWIDLNMALANEIAMLSDNLGVDAQNVLMQLIRYLKAEVMSIFYSRG